MALNFCFFNISKEIKIIIIMKWHCVKNNHIFPFYWLIRIVYLFQKYWTLLSFTTFLVHKHNCGYCEILSKLHFYWNFLKTIAILLIIAEMVITIFQPITCICFFARKISKLWKLFKFPVVQSGPTAGP